MLSTGVFIAVLCILLPNTECIQNAEILEPPITQYTLIQENATFTCKTFGREAYWVLNGIPITITYPDQRRYYENQGVAFMEDSSRDYYNLTMIIFASSFLNNTVIYCSVIGSDYTVTMSQEAHLVVFNTLRPYQPAVTIDISYNTSNQGEQPTMITMITEVPRWPGYQTSEFKINISNVGDNTLLRQINISEPRNGTIELRTSLPRSITNCSLFRVTVYALSEAYGESEPTEAYVELFKSPGEFPHNGINLTTFHLLNGSALLAVQVQLPDVCRNQPINYTITIGVGEAAGEVDTVILMDGPYFHIGAGLVTHYIDGLDKDRNYFIQVQVDSISGSSTSQKHHFDTHYQVTEHQQTGTMKNTVTQVKPGILEIKGSSNFIALGISLALISLMLVTISIILVLFCVYHYKSIGQKSQHSTSSVMDFDDDNIMMSSTETAVTDKKC